MAFCCIQRKVGGHGLPLSRVRESERAPIKGTKEKLSRWQRRRKIYWSSKCSSVHLWAVVIAWLRVRYGHGLMLWPSVLHLWHAYRVFLITMQYRTYVRCVSTVVYRLVIVGHTSHVADTLWLCTVTVYSSRHGVHGTCWRHVILCTAADADIDDVITMCCPGWWVVMCKILSTSISIQNTLLYACQYLAFITFMIIMLTRSELDKSWNRRN